MVLIIMAIHLVTRLLINGLWYYHVICDVIERRACETFKNYRSTFDDVTDDVIIADRQHYVILLRNVGGLLGDVIPLN